LAEARREIEQSDADAAHKQLAFSVLEESAAIFAAPTATG
jgi:hypothetical protein